MLWLTLVFGFTLGLYLGAILGNWYASTLKPLGLVPSLPRFRFGVAGPALAPAADPRVVPLHEAGKARPLALEGPFETPYRSLVAHFVIRGAQLGDYSARAMIGRRILGQVVDWRLWRDVTDESWLFVKTKHGTRLRWGAAEAIRRLGAGLTLANEKTHYGPDEVEILPPS